MLCVEPQLTDGKISTLYTSSLGEYTANVVQLLKQVQEWDKKTHKGRPEVFEGLDFSDFTEAIQEGYQRTIADRWSMEREHFDELKKLTGIAVSEETVQHAINARIKARNVLGEDYYFKKQE